VVETVFTVWFGGERTNELKRGVKYRKKKKKGNTTAQDV
jgi:hypothetical protein